MKLKKVFLFLILIFAISLIGEMNKVQAANTTTCKYCRSTAQITSTKTATCTTAGTRTISCSKCGNTYTESIPKLEHDYKVIGHQGATCVKSGLLHMQCTRCKNSYWTTDESNQPLGHDYQVTSNVAATCGKNGYKTEKCSRCGDTKTTTYYATGNHQYVNGVCKVCGAKTTYSQTECTHTWKDATCETPKTCSLCGATQGSALGHNYVDGVCTRCGKNVDSTSDEWIVIDGEIKARLLSDGTLEIVGDGTSKDFKGEKSPLNSIRYSIKKVHIKGELTTIPGYLFYYATNLEEVIIDKPSSIQYIGEGAFFGCKQLKSFEVPENITTIGARGFCHCHSLETIDLTKCTKFVRIGHEAFRDCWLLETVKLPEGLKVIGYEAFLNCISLKNLIIPSTVQAIGTLGRSHDESGIGTADENTTEYNNVFTIDFNKNSGTEYESYIQLVLERNSYRDILDALTETRVWYYPTHDLLATYAAQKAETEMKISTMSWDISENGDKTITATLDPQGKLTIEGTGAIKNYEQEESPWNELKSYITEIEIGEGITAIGQNLFYDHTNLATVSMPTTLDTISYGAFNECYNLQTLTIPNSVTIIEGFAFRHCEELTTITIPEGVKKIEEETFSNCYKLQTVKVLGDIVELGNCAFFNCPSLETFRVSPYVEEMREDVFKVDFSKNEDERYLEVKDLTLNKVEYYVISEVMKQYVEENNERAFEIKNIDELTITNPEKTTYCVGEELDTEGLVLTVGYYNGTTQDTKQTKEITEDFTCEPTNLNTQGTQTITVHYGEQANTFDVTVEGHNWAEWEETTPATCTEKGEETRECANCHEIETRETSALGHDWNAKTGICNRCKIECAHNRFDPETGKCDTCGMECKHEWEDGDEVGAAGKCVCEICSYQITHIYGDWEITEAATCTKPGRKIKKCINCGHVGETETIPALGHSFTEYKSNNDATCEEDGTKTAKCDRCDEKNTITDEGSAKGHNWGEWTITTPATCTEKGEETRECANCHETETREIKALGHSFTSYKSNNDATCEEDGTKTAKCDRCDETNTITDEGSAKGHNWNDGEVTKEATCEEEGIRTYTCKNDSAHTKIEAIPKTAHNYVDGTCTECGKEDPDYEGLTTESSKYNLESGYLSLIQPKTTVSMLKEEIITNKVVRTNAEKITVYKEDGTTQVKDTEKVATGMKIEFTLGEQSRRYTIAVAGDVNGDGEADFKDIVLMNKHRLGITTLSGEYLLAGDVNGDGDAGFKDIVVVNKYRLGIITSF